MALIRVSLVLCACFRFCSFGQKRKRTRAPLANETTPTQSLINNDLLLPRTSTLRKLAVNQLRSSKYRSHSRHTCCRHSLTASTALQRSVFAWVQPHDYSTHCGIRIALLPVRSTEFSSITTYLPLSPFSWTCLLLRGGPAYCFGAFTSSPQMRQHAAPGSVTIDH